MARIVKPFKWYGGKGQILSRLMPLVPPGGRPYVEPYAGSAALFFARPPAPVEVLNDIDKRVVNFYRVMQDDKRFKILKKLIRQTLYSRAEFARAIETLRDERAGDVERAWAFFTVANQSLLGAVHKATRASWTHVRASTARGMASPVAAWHRRVEMLDVFALRLARVQIECIDALRCISTYDCNTAVFYVDPPFVAGTRTHKEEYAHETTDDHHRALVQTILQCKGAVVVSAYDHEIYAPLDAAGWERVDIANTANLPGRGQPKSDPKAARTETVWRNPRAVELTRGLM